MTAPAARSGEFFAPLPLAAVGVMLVNDVWLKPALHSELTGKLSDVAVCFFMPLFVSELLGIVFGIRPRVRLLAGGAFTTLLYAGLEVVPPFTRLVLRALALVGPHIGIARTFRMTSDWSDLLCLALVPVAVAYGDSQLRGRPAAPSRGPAQAGE